MVTVVVVNKVGLEFGSFRLVEVFHVCAGDCRHPSGALVTQRAQSVTQRLLPRSTVGYDVMTWAGLQRFLYHRQREETQAELERRGVALSTGELGKLQRRFLQYLERLHEDRTPALRTVLEMDGGWPLQADATGEGGRGTLLVALAGWRGWVLEAWKISTECEEQILPHLLRLCGRFGKPCAVMGASAESEGEIWLGQVAKRVVERYFDGVVGPESVGPFCRQSRFAV